jgi:hypothetical protein
MGQSHGCADCVTLPAAVGEYELAFVIDMTPAFGFSVER